MPENLSVIIPHYGEAEPTLAVVTRLHEQVFPGEMQVIIVDDASPIPLPDVSGCEVVRREANGGFGAAVNSGAARAAYEYLLILNSDVTFEDNFLQQLFDGARPWMPAVVAPSVIEGGQKRCIGRNWPTWRSDTLETVDILARFHGSMWFEELIGNDTKSWHSEHPEVVDWAVGVCLLMPTASFHAVGGIDERYFMNCEEIDLQRKLHTREGVATIVLPRPIIQHVGGGSSVSSSRSGWLYDARFRYHTKWGGAVKLLAGLSAASSLNLATNYARSGAGREVEPVKKFRRQMTWIRHGWETRK